MEPLSVAMHAISTVAKLRANQTVAIFGCGPVGLLCMAVAKALGASRIIAVDIVPSRVEFAVNYAATESFLPPPFEPGETKIAYSRRAASLMKEKLGIEERGKKSLDLWMAPSGTQTSCGPQVSGRRHCREHREPKVDTLSSTYSPKLKHEDINLMII